MSDAYNFINPYSVEWANPPIPRLLFECDLDPATRWLYVHIAYRCLVSGKCYESVPNMARACATSVRTTQHQLSRLVKLGMLARQDREGETSLLVLTPPSQWRVGTSAQETPPQNLRGGGAKSAPPQNLRGSGIASPTQKRGTPAKSAEESVSNLVSSSKRSGYKGVGKRDVVTTLSSHAHAQDDDEPGFEDVELPDVAQQVVDAWNEVRGKLPRVLSVEGQRAKVNRAEAHWRTRRLSVGKSDPRALSHSLADVVRIAARQVHAEGMYLKGGYGLTNLLQGSTKGEPPKLFDYYEKALASMESEPVPVDSSSLKVGDVVTWGRSEGRYYCYVLEVGEGRVRFSVIESTASGRGHVYTDIPGDWRSTKGMLVVDPPFDFEVLSLAEERAERKRRLDSLEESLQRGPQGAKDARQTLPRGITPDQDF